MSREVKCSTCCSRIAVEALVIGIKVMMGERWEVDRERENEKQNPLV